MKKVRKVKNAKGIIFPDKYESIPFNLMYEFFEGEFIKIRFSVFDEFIVVEFSDIERIRLIKLVNFINANIS